MAATAAVNRVPVSQPISNFVCPSDPELADIVYTVGGADMPLASYLGNGGSTQYSFIPAEDFADGILSRSSDDRHLGLKLGSVTDGTSNTFFCGETISYTAALNAVFVWDPAMYAETTGNSAARTLTQVRTGHGVFSPDLATYRNNIAVLRNLYASRHLSLIHI